MKRYTAQELRKLPTLTTGQADDMKIEDLDAGVRVWLSRCTVADGEPYNNKISVERYNESERRWETVEEYPG